MISRDRALAILDECTGDTIWPVDHCRLRRVPEAWINELADAFESNLQHDPQTIYVDEGRTNQFHGVRDVDLAIKTGLALGVDVERLQERATARRSLVMAIKDALEEG